MKPLRVALVANDIGEPPDWVGTELAAAGVEWLDQLCETPDDVVRAACEADVVWLMGGSKIVTADVLPGLKRCRVILRTGSGTDNVPVAEATRRGIVVANTPDAIAPAVAEHTLGLLLAASRRIAVHDRLIRQGVWDRHRSFPDCSLAGKTLGLVGFGRIARLVAAKASGFDLRKIAFDPLLQETNLAPDVRLESFEDLLAQSDFISIHVPLIESTRHLIGASEFRRMKPSAILINTSRGPVVDQTALIAALAERRIAAAALDVLETEPPEADCPLLSMDNVVLTPHIAACSEKFADLFWRHSVRTLQAIAATGKPLWRVN